MNCPYCNEKCEAEFIDIGVGMQQCSPYVCPNCHAVQIGSYDNIDNITKEELEKRFYFPTTP